MMKRLTIYILIYLLIFFPSMQAWGATWYVDADAADDTGAGTEISPWKYIPGQTSSTHTGDVSSGDTIYCQKGDTWTEQIMAVAGVIYDAYGTGANPIIDVTAVNNAYGIFGNNLVTSTVKNFTVKGSGAAAAVRYQGTSGAGSYGVRLENVVVENDSALGDDDDHDCVSADNTAEIWLETCALTKCKRVSGATQHQAVTPHTTSKIYMNGGSISDSSIAAQPGAGTSEIYLYGVTVGTIINKIAELALATASPITLDNCTINIDSTGHLFGSSGDGGAAQVLTVKDSTINVTGAPSAAFLRGSTVVLTNNDVTINMSGGFPIQTFSVASAIVSTGNRYIPTVTTSQGLLRLSLADSFTSTGDTFSGVGGIFLRLDAAASTATFNTTIVNGGTSQLVNIMDNFSGNAVFNNATVYNNSAYLVASSMTSADTGTLAVKNSIFHTVTDPIWVPAVDPKSPTVSNNVYFNSGDEGGAGSLTSDPLFRAAGTDFHLQVSSPAIYAGTDVSLTSDFDGLPIRGSAPNIGAYESHQKIF